MKKGERGARLRHGHSRRGMQTPTWRSWGSMIRRCYTPSEKGFQHWGGRGITVCERWRSSFENFLADMGERPPGTTLDRIDNERGYEPGNCQWADWTHQNKNRRYTRWVEHNGQRLCLKDWAKQLGIPYQTLHMRLIRGWSEQKALTTPVSPAHRQARLTRDTRRKAASEARP